jgi:hypothetical protein
MRHPAVLHDGMSDDSAARSNSAEDVARRERDLQRLKIQLEEAEEALARLKGEHLQMANAEGPQKPQPPE